ncbi:DNA-binding PadR family transcriptional regulator [Sphingomonas kyeonggiensis]|uniref:PadR family transcriptional regulator n=1 Tax=Sphingomonas kyeonggiensis TaxID=1268553 RepID=UPI0027820F8B|nr:PadR family transcriptional regulator [Sphingomonas kyeonggiensis]MDQ0250339.1 DNA-binding PadR family transcriptional regulator [Sphingomonas kyeonggiensis]
MRHHHCGPRGFVFGRRGGFGGGPDFVMGWGMGARGRGGFGHGERGGRRRMFDGTELRLILLKLIEEQPRHGYDLIREIEERSGGAYAPSPGVVYPTLSMLDEMGLIEEAKTEGAKKQFAITVDGTAHLAERAEEVEALFERLKQLASMRERSDGGPIRRAMGNLRTVLQERLAAEGVGADMLHDVAEILDEAARKIERL